MTWNVFAATRVCVGLLYRLALVALALIAGSTVAFAQFQGNNGGGRDGNVAAMAVPQPEITRSIPASAVALREQADLSAE